MADLILVCSRPGRPPVAAERVRHAAQRLAPPGVPLREPLLLEAAGATAAVANPTCEGVFLHHGADGSDNGPAGGAACVGGLFGKPGPWWSAGTDAPEGTYALVRWNADTVELLSDIGASRTLWYALTEDAFLTSTSQRALVMLLGSFELEVKATACFLASGTLGPTVSWDARLRRVLPDARVDLDRATWRLQDRRAPFVLSTAAGDDAAHVARLRAAIETTCGSLNLDLERWVLALSGGRDSRTLLAFLVENGLRPRCVTWTTRASLRNPLSDASIARRLTRRYRVEHELLLLDAKNVDAETVVARFVAANEGRNDEIAGYMDGFAIWRDLAQGGVTGVIRGDQMFGANWHPRNAEQVRLTMCGETADDYPQGHVIRRLHLASQTWPDHVSIAPGESLVDYGQRYEEQGYNAIVLAGLNASKARYLEIVNPHLSRAVIGAVHALTPRLRDYTRGYARIADALDRTIPYARFSSTPSASDLLASPELLKMLARDLTSPGAARVLSDDGPILLLTALALSASDTKNRWADWEERLKDASICLPYNFTLRLADRLRPVQSEADPLPTIKLAFRALLATRTVDLFETDAEAVKERPDG